MQYRAKECEHSCLIALLNIIKDYSIAKMVELVCSSLSCEVILSIIALLKFEALIGAVRRDSDFVNLGCVVIDSEGL